MASKTNTRLRTYLANLISFSVLVITLFTWYLVYEKPESIKGEENRLALFLLIGLTLAFIPFCLSLFTKNNIEKKEQYSLMASGIAIVCTGIGVIFQITQF